MSIITFQPGSILFAEQLNAAFEQVYSNAVNAVNQSLAANASCQSTAQRPLPTYIGQPCLDLQLGYVVYARQLNPPIWQNAEGVYPL
ncbi:hypothetical protein ACO0K2_17675 [Undibacterium sp. MH2W]|uniref:hypothetical protein n=1 Tax=Undibacterium sp. MH2W TaxID=3413044 RepID=UPI003BEFF8A0